MAPPRAPLSGTGSLGVNLEVVGTQICTSDLVAEGTTLGVLAGAVSIYMGGLRGARAQAISLGFKVSGGLRDAFTLAGSREI
jgi:hypothetical protein